MNLDFKYLQEHLQKNDIFIDNTDYIIKQNSKIGGIIENNLFLRNVNILHKTLKRNRENLPYQEYNKIAFLLEHNIKFLKWLYEIDEVRRYLINNIEVSFEEIRKIFNNLIHNLEYGFYITDFNNNEIKLEKVTYSFPSAKIYRYSSMIGMFAQDNNRDKSLPYREQLGMFLVGDNEDVECFLNNYVSHYICLNGKYVPLNDKDILIDVIEQIYYNIILYNQYRNYEITSKYDFLMSYLSTDIEKEFIQIKVSVDDLSSKEYANKLKEKIILYLLHSNCYIELDFSNINCLPIEFYTTLFSIFGQQKYTELLLRIYIKNIDERGADLIKMAIEVGKTMLDM